MKKIAFIVRGNLEKPDRFRANISKYFQTDYNVFLKFTRRAGHAIDIVKQIIIDESVDYVIAVGGDGTFSEVVNGYMLLPPAMREQVVLAAFPRGAGNDFCRSAGSIQSMEHLRTLIDRNEHQKLDLCKVSYEQDGLEHIRYFDNSFDIGIGGLVCQYVNVSNKTWGSNFTYFYNILRAFLSFKRLAIEVEADTFSFKGNVLLFSVNNGKYFGSGLCIAPNAQLNDGKADVLIARKINMLQFLRHVPNLKRARKINHPEVFYHQLTKCTISSPLKNLPMELDGEVVGKTPLKLEVLAGVANLLKIS